MSDRRQFINVIEQKEVKQKNAKEKSRTYFSMVTNKQGKWADVFLTRSTKQFLRDRPTRQKTRGSLGYIVINLELLAF
jgi:hypothetical protein